jgi:hypothetical protein
VLRKWLLHKGNVSFSKKIPYKTSVLSFLNVTRKVHHNERRFTRRVSSLKPKGAFERETVPVAPASPMKTWNMCGRIFSAAGGSPLGHVVPIKFARSSDGFSTGLHVLHEYHMHSLISVKYVRNLQSLIMYMCYMNIIRMASYKFWQLLSRFELFYIYARSKIRTRDLSTRAVYGHSVLHNTVTSINKYFDVKCNFNYNTFTSACKR